MYTIAITVLTVAQLTMAQMGFGGGGYCATCAMKRQGMTSPGFGFGGGSAIPSASTAPQIQTGYGTTFGNNFGYTSTVGTQLPTSTVINTGSLPNTYTSPFVISSSICPTGKCNCNSGVCTSCSSCGWNKVRKIIDSYYSLISSSALNPDLMRILTTDSNINNKL
uniref:Uncharacterized protein n=1 Tax=Syphacia muris TaxID=451379 RepID=A0A0N5AHN5_9BILA